MTNSAQGTPSGQRTREGPPPKREDNTLDEQHAGIDRVSLPVTDNDQGEGEGAESHVRPARSVSAPDRHRRIADRAYQLAERRGFAPGEELDDWLAAEKEVDDPSH